MIIVVVPVVGICIVLRQKIHQMNESSKLEKCGGFLILYVLYCGTVEAEPNSKVGKQVE